MASRFTGLVLILSLALWGGCSSRDDAAQLLLRRARDLRGAKDIPAAVRVYHEALDRQPDLAEAHLELGQLFDQELGDDLRAIYHYERFLDLKPTSERADIVKELIRAARISFAASIPEARSDLLRQIQTLQREILLLRARLAEVSPPPPAPVTGVVAPVQVPAPPPATTNLTMYTVKSGDNLRSIAGQQLGDPTKWRLIYAANRDRIRSQNQLKVGQQIVIPKH